MGIYLIRRILYAVPILIGVNLLTFLLFFGVNSPDNMARAQLGNKRISSVQIDQWKHLHGYDLPKFYNADQEGLNKFRLTIFFQKSLSLFNFNFGMSLEGRQISDDIRARMWPSLAIALPTLIIGVIVNISLALFAVLFRYSVFDLAGVFLCVILMSISSLFYIIAGQFLFAKWWQWFPISGYQSGWSSWRFVALPVMVGVLSGIGVGVRWYRSLFLEEMDKDYVRYARAKGLAEFIVLFKHVLKNALLPILTGLVVIIPSLFLGSLIMESFFGIPGLGSYTIDAIHAQDFEVVRVMVFIGTLLYLIGLVLTDISYALVDPRIRLGAQHVA